MRTGAPAVVVAFLACQVFATAAEFTVRVGNVGARVRPLNGVNAGPGHMNPPSLARHVYADQYREMGITLVRAHDYYGPCDLSTIFPWGWGPHEMLPADTYRFAETDAVLEEIAQAGCSVLFRLGESWRKGETSYPLPPDFSQVAGVCAAIVRRYSGPSPPGGQRVRLWEIWNEPNHYMFWDLQADPHSEQFFDLYAEIARTLRHQTARIKLGGPGTAGGTTQEITDFAARFAQACLDRDAPLDFYSWHSYNRDHEGPYVFARQAQAVRQALIGVDPSLARVENVLSEWSSTHYFGGEPSQENLEWNATLNNMDGAAFTAAALVYMNLYSDLTYACRYRGDAWVPDDGYGLIKTNGELKKPGYAFKAYSYLFQGQGNKPMHTLATSGGDTGDEGAADHCRAIIATTNEDQSTVNVLISLWRSGGGKLKVTVKNLPAGWHRPWMVHFRVTSQADWETVATGKCTLGKDRSFVYEAFSQRPPPYGRQLSEIHVLRFFDAGVLSGPTLPPGQPKPLPNLHKRPPRPPKPPKPPRPPIPQPPRPKPPRAK